VGKQFFLSAGKTAKEIYVLVSIASQRSHFLEKYAENSQEVTANKTDTPTLVSWLVHLKVEQTQSWNARDQGRNIKILKLADDINLSEGKKK